MKNQNHQKRLLLAATIFLFLVSVGCGKLNTTDAGVNGQAGTRSRTQVPGAPQSGQPQPAPQPGLPETSGAPAAPAPTSPAPAQSETQTPAAEQEPGSPAAPAPQSQTPAAPVDPTQTPVTPGSATVQPGAPEQSYEGPAPAIDGGTVQPTAPQTTTPAPNRAPPKPNATPAPQARPNQPAVPARPNQAPTPAPQARPNVNRPAQPAPVQPRPSQPEPTRPSESQTPSRQLSAGEIAETGTMKPTVYYFPVFDEDKSGCDANESVNFYGTKGEVLMRVCASTEKACGLQGSCAIIKNGKSRSYNILTRVNGQDRFFEIEEDGCKFGYGVSQICLDPFYTLAADLDVYRPGDVIYVPAVAGLQLPNGRVHDGFFVVRDRGRGINGKGRFDFFSGFFSWRNSTNPFTKIGLTDQSTNVPYYKVTGDRASRIKSLRGYPGLPSSPIASRPTNASTATVSRSVPALMAP